MSAARVAVATGQPAGDAAGDLFQLHPVASLLVDASGRIADANQATEALLNQSRTALTGKPLTGVLGSERQAQIVRLLADPSASARLFAVALPALPGTKLLVDIIIGGAHGDDGMRMIALHQVPGTARDTALRPGAAARSAAAAAAMLAHEIKNPLSGIRGAAQLLGRQAKPGGGPLVELICGEVDRIAALIDSMEGFTRGAPLSVAALNIFPALSQAREIAAAGFAAQAVFDERFDPAVPPIRANHDALVQVLINLIKNAAEAARPDQRPTIRLSTAWRHGFAWDAGDGQGHIALPVEIAVLDDGPGIPAEMIDLVFDPFVSGKKDGQGLGLALVDKLMRDMGGLIQHDRVDGWTRFRLCFQAAPAQGRGD